MVIALLTGFILAGPVLTAPTAPAVSAPQCQFGPNVTASCPPGGCPEDVLGQAQPCSGPLLEPLFPEQPPVKIELGLGAGS